MSRSFARKLKEQSYFQRLEEQEHEEASQAAARLAAELGSWTSPRLGSNSIFVRNNRDIDSSSSDSVEWLKRDAPDTAINTTPSAEETTPKLPLTKTPKRTKLLDRSETPVMSNASRKKGRDSIIMEMEIEPLPVQTPGLATGSPYATSPYEDDVESLPDSIPMTAIAVSRSMPSAASSHNDYRRYHDALSAFIKAKRQLSAKIELMKASAQEHMDIEDDDDTPQNALATISDIVPTNVDATLLSDEKRTDMIFLRNLAAISYDRAIMELDMTEETRKEGNFWMLLYHLRSLGVDALVWDDYPTTKSLYREGLRLYLQTLASDVDSTPLQLIESLKMQSCPLVLQRRQGILLWLQECFQKLLPSGATRERLTGIVESQLLMRQGLPETDKDPELLRLSLALILAGRLDDALALVRSSGVPWRAAQWSGGEPHGYTTSSFDANTMPTPVGNPRRPLWRHMMRLHSENLNSSPSADKNEAAIAALLSNSLRDALANPSMRSWEKGLYAAFYCVLGRMEDEMLHIHNNNRRKLNPPYPGTEFEEKEREHLEATAEIADVDEAEIVRILDSTPFDEMRCNDVVSRATASFLVGKNSISSLLKDIDEVDGTTLRFVTHLALFLDSLAMASTPVHLDGLQLLRSELLVRYLQHLASREDLWYTLVCYASMLPVEVVGDHLPQLLVNIENHEDRKVVVHQLKEFMTKPGIDKELLCKVIDIVFNQDDDITSTDTPTPLDYRKMKAVLWLCQSNDHAVQAIVSANTLLRQFLLQDKIQSALLFMDDIFPLDIFEQVDGVVADSESGGGVEDVVVVESARSELRAFKSFLEAIRAYQQWMDTVEMTPTQQSVIDDTVDRNLLNATEIAVADKVERRMLLEEKRRAGNAVVTVADKAQKALSRVLEHPGGWLMTEDEDFAREAPEEYNRRRELEELRAKILPHVVKIYISVCLDTSRWISAALDDAVEKLNCTRENAIQQLDDSSILVDGTSDRSPVDPQYWTKIGMRGARLATSETYGIRSACSSQYRSEILSALGTLVQVDVMYGTPDDSRLVGS